MEIETSFYELASQQDDSAYRREVKKLIRRTDTQQDAPPPKRPRLSQESINFSQREAEYPGADGTIRSITMENFMCHGNLKLDFNPKVNFLIGQNGSGKSAILTAITVGLGAQARETGRGKSLKDLIKNGVGSATVIIELYNKKKRRLDGKDLEAGKIVTVKRTIGTTNTVQIKYQNRVISSKMDSLHNLTRSMGIQINNPISVLDQNTSKTFLAQSSSAVKYELFMRATALDDIQRFHEEINSRIAKIELDAKQKKRDLKHRLEFDKDLIKKYKEVEALMSLRSERSEILEELLWSKANSFEARLKEKERQLESMSREFREHQSGMEAENEDDGFAADVARLDDELEIVYRSKEKTEKEMKECRDEVAEKMATAQRDEQELKRLHVKMMSVKSMVTEYKKQIEQEVAKGDPTERLKKQREAIAMLTEEVGALERELEAKENEKFATRANASRLEEELNNVRRAKVENEEKKSKLEREIRTIAQDESNLSIYGDYIPALVREIDAAAGTFRKKPIGPLGLYVKLRDEQWGPAVEAVISGLLTSFCVESSQDEGKLKAILSRVCRGTYPMIIRTKFVNEIHNTSRRAVRSPDFQNMLDILDFSHPMAANVMIDKATIERILLIPDDAACQHLLSNVATVPRNCGYAITLKRDTYYPAPTYRSYAARGRNDVRFLKASKEAILQNLRAVLNDRRRDVQAVDVKYREVDAQARSAKAEASQIERTIREMGALLQSKRRELNELKNQEEPEESFVVSLRAELRGREEELEELRDKMKTKTEEVKKIKSSWEDQKNCLANLKTQYDELKVQERKLKEEKDVIDDKKAKRSQQRESRREQMESLRNIIGTLDSEIEEFRRQLAKAREEAQKYESVGNDLGSQRSSDRGRKMTRRRPGDIEKDLMALDTKIRTLEGAIGGNEDEVVQKFQEMKRQTADIEALLKRNENCTNALQQAMKVRRFVFNGLMRMNKIAIDCTFRRVLKQRGYKGSLNFSNSRMEIVIGLSEDDSRSTSTLSGGERSFGTMALLIALWYVTKLPFYFMDEFDVFMDMANRETIMDLMMDYTRKRDYQFCFLTPLNTSNIQAANDVTIHRLEPPRKA